MGWLCQWSSLGLPVPAVIGAIHRHFERHVGILADYLSEAKKDRLRGWEAYKSRDRSGHETYTKGQRRYRIHDHCL